MLEVVPLRLVHDEHHSVVHCGELLVGEARRIHLELRLADVSFVLRMIVSPGKPRRYIFVSVSMARVFVACPAGARPSEERFTAFTSAHVRVEPAPALFSVAVSLALLFTFLFPLLLHIEAIIQLKLKAVRHGGFVAVSDLDAHLLGHAKKKVLAKLQKVLLFELLHVVGALHFVGIATGLDCKRIRDLPVPINTQARAVSLILLIAELAVVVLEVGREVVEDHGEALDNSVVVRVFVDRRVAKNRILGRVRVDVEKHAQHVFTRRYVLFHEAADQLDLREAYLQSFWVIVGEKVAIHVLALGIAAVVPDDNAVWVHDRCNPELKQVSHLVTDDLARDEEVNEAMDDKGRVSLATVLPANDENDWLLLGRVL